MRTTHTLRRGSGNGIENHKNRENLVKIKIQPLTDTWSVTVKDEAPTLNFDPRSASQQQPLNQPDVCQSAANHEDFRCHIALRETSNLPEHFEPDLNI